MLSRCIHSMLKINKIHFQLKLLKTRRASAASSAVIVQIACWLYCREDVIRQQEGTVGW